MERQLEELQNEMEYKTDRALAQLICSQRINEMISQLQQSEQSVDIQPSTIAWSAQLDNLLAELHDLRATDDKYQSHHRTSRDLRLIYVRLTNTIQTSLPVIIILL